MQSALAALALMFATTSCAARDHAPTATAEHASLRGEASKDGAVGTYVSSPWGFSTSSYWLEGPKGLVAIDTQFLPSAAEEMIAEGERLTGKKFVLAIVLHANPDKFNGTSVFQKHGVRVVTSAQVKAVMPEIHAKRVDAFYERYRPDYPRALPEPEVFGDKTTRLEAAGLELRLHVLGAGCSEAHVVVEHGGDVYVGDLVANQHHSWLEIGKTDQWLERLEEIRRLRPSRVFPGRGKPGTARLLDDEETYLKKVIAVVASERPTLPIPETSLERAKRAIVEAFPGYGFPVFLEIGLPAEWERQAHQRQAPTPKPKLE